jgi:uncharacterized protein involved in exopolysaccharide biosynthesis
MNTGMSSEGASSWRQLRDVIGRRWRVIGISTLLFGIAAGVIDIVMTPVYRSTVLFIPADVNERTSGLTSAIGQLGGLAAIAGLSLSGSSQSATAEAVAVLKSRQFILEFVDKNGLMPELFPRDWNDKTKNWKNMAKIPTPGRAYKRFADNIMDVYQDRKTNLISLDINWTDRQEAAKWANGLLSAVNARMRQRTISEADQTISFLQQELRRADTVEVKAAISSMMESQLKIKAVATVREQYAFRVIDQAVASDRDVMVRPHRTLYLAVGLAVGLLLGIVVAFLAPGQVPKIARRA